MQALQLSVGLPRAGVPQAHARLPQRAAYVAAAARRPALLSPRCSPRLRAAQRQQQRARRRSALCLAAGAPQPGRDEGRDEPPALVITPKAAVLFLAGSTAFYALTTAASVALGVAVRAPDVIAAAAMPVPYGAAFTYVAPLALSLVAAMAGAAAGVPALVEMKLIFTASIVPLLRAMPPPAWALLAAGAGIGEEALFRGVLLPGAASALAAAGLQAGPAAGLAVASTSLLFGALHAVTPLYFAWATAAGLLFSAEMYATGSLGACMLSHALYDLLAFAVVQAAWAGELDDTRP